jgi:hypothetical protein
VPGFPAGCSRRWHRRSRWTRVRSKQPSARRQVAALHPVCIRIMRVTDQQTGLLLRLHWPRRRVRLHGLRPVIVLGILLGSIRPPSVSPGPGRVAFCDSSVMAPPCAYLRAYLRIRQPTAEAIAGQTQRPTTTGIPNRTLNSYVQLYLSPADRPYESVDAGVVSPNSPAAIRPVRVKRPLLDGIEAIRRLHMRHPLG